MSNQVQAIRTGIRVAGDVADLHARIEYHTASGLPAIEWCGVYVHPVTFAGPSYHAAKPLVPGYWYFPEGTAARELLTVAGVLTKVQP